MKDDTSTPTPEGLSPNEFERGKPRANARSDAESGIEELRQRGGIFVEAVRAVRMPMALTDPDLPGNPIVFANDAFLKLSGYRMDEVLGQQPFFMNGPDTDPKDTARLEEGLRSDLDDIVETIQYRKNGSPFVATVLLGAFQDSAGRTIHHSLSWLDVTGRVGADDEVHDLRKAQALQDVAERTRAETSLAQSEEKYRNLFESMDEAYAVVEVLKDEQGKWADFLFLDANPAFMKHTSMPYPVGKTATELLGSPNPRWTKLYGHALHTGQPLRVEETEHSLGRTFDLNIFALDRDKNRVAVLFTNITERKRNEDALRKSERHSNMLLAELQHRVRNTLAVVRSIARRTAGNAESAEDMLAHFQGRLDAFSRVQAAITRNPAARVDLASLIDDELVAHATREGEQVLVEGPPVTLGARSAERLSLAIHELTTNAVKHGALVNERGRIKVSWDKLPKGDGDELLLTWEESGVQLDGREPNPDGFGMELLRQSLAYDLQGDTKVDLQKTGLRFELRMPLNEEAPAVGA